MKSTPWWCQGTCSKKKKSSAIEAMEAALSRCYLALNTIGMTPPPEDIYEYTRWQFQVSVFAQRARHPGPDGMKDKNAMDIGSVRPHRNSSSKSIRRGPYLSGTVDEALSQSFQGPGSLVNDFFSWLPLGSWPTNLERK